MDDLFQDMRSHNIASAFTPDAQVTLFHGDRLLLLQQIADAGCRAELIVTSPPYNTGKEYENQASLEDYIEGQR